MGYNRMSNKRDTDASQVVGQVWLNKRDIQALKATGGGGIPGGDVPMDGMPYSRQDGGWVLAGAGGGIPEAPNNGIQYGRQSLGWTPIVSGALYDGVDLEANIKAMDATALLGQTWWASDTKVAIDAITLTTNAVPANVWQNTTAQYDGSSDTYFMPTTQDGQTQNIGQESFTLGVNVSLTPVTAIAPKLFLLSDQNPTFLSFDSATLIDGAGLSNGARFGLNTVDAAVGEPMKVARLGDLKGVDTSLWGQGDTLYASTVPGDLTNIQPLDNAYIIGQVVVSNAVNGIIAVNTLSAANILTNTAIFGGTPYYLTADVSPIDIATYEILANSKGILDDVVIALADDNQTVEGDKRFIAALGLTGDSQISAGVYQGKLEVSQDQNQANERIYLEAYLADALGAPVDASPLGVPGSLGINAITIYSSSVKNMPVNTIQDITISATVLVDTPVLATQNLLYVPLFEKIGALGPAKTFIMSVGANADSFIQGLGQSAFELVPYTGATKDVNLNTNNLDAALINGVPITALGVATNFLTEAGTYAPAGGGSTPTLQEVLDAGNESQTTPVVIAFDGADQITTVASTHVSVQVGVESTRVEFNNISWFVDGDASTLSPGVTGQGGSPVNWVLPTTAGTLALALSGDTTARLLAVSTPVGQSYWDTTLKKPCYLEAGIWYDAVGVVIP